MSFFEKFKNMHTGPPAPPKRIDSTAGFGWSEDEFEDGGDTYEPPPRDWSDIKVQPQLVDENVYLDYPDRSPQRAAPPPRPTKNPPKKLESLPNQNDFYFDHNERKRTEVASKDKPKRKPPAIPEPLADDDVYLDPNEGQCEREPAPTPMPARPPLPGGIRMLPASVPLPVILKPPIPRATAKSGNGNPTDPRKKAPSVPPPSPPSEAKHQTFSNRAAIPSPTSPSAVDVAAPVRNLAIKEDLGLQDTDWYAGQCGRKIAEEALLRVNTDGCFMVRCSTAQNTNQPFTLAVLFNQKVYNIPVRFLRDSGSYALGKEGKKTEELFGSLHEIISYHMTNPLLLIDSKSQAKHSTYLATAVIPNN